MAASASTSGAGPAPPPFAIGGPTTASWREHVLARVAEHRFLVVWLKGSTDAPNEKALAAVTVHLDAAEDAATGSSQPRRHKLWSAFRGASVERARSHVDAAEMELLVLAPDSYLIGQLPNLVAHVRCHLPSTDPRRERVEELYEWSNANRTCNHAPTGGREPREQKADRLDPSDRDAIVSAVREASSQARREVTRVRSYRNLLSVSAFVLALAATGMIVIATPVKPFRQTRAALAESYARAAVRDELATDDVRVTGRDGRFRNPPSENGLTASPGVCATASLAASHHL